MKKLLSIFILSATFFVSCTVKQVNPVSRTVSVTGRGEVKVKNDQAVISLSVITRNWDINKATEENATKMTNVQEALIKKGILKENISTSDFSIHQESSYQQGKTVYGQYNVTNQINILVKEINNAGSIIDTAIKAGANQLSSINYSASSTEAATKEARIQAVKNAEAIANTIVTASGASLGKVMELSENSSFSARNNLFMAKAFVTEDAAIETPVSGGSSTVTVTVNAVYEIN